MMRGCLLDAFDYHMTCLLHLHFNVTKMWIFHTREVSDQEIESDRRKRRTIEELKQKELQSERSRLTQWQKGGLPPAPIGHAQEDARAEENWHDQPCYHGRGYWPGRDGGSMGPGDQGGEGVGSDSTSRGGCGGDAERRIGEIWECGEDECEGEGSCDENGAAEEGEVRKIGVWCAVYLAE